MIRGACPGALRPMMSGDGLLARVRPRLGRLSATQARGIAEAALRHASGDLDLTRRANLQIRAVRDHGALLADLDALGLVDPDPAAETRRNLLVEPTRHPDSLRIAREIEDGLAMLPDLPPKFGFAVDCGAAPMLGEAPADVRIERTAKGFAVRADGLPTGRPASPHGAPLMALALARLFARLRGPHRRMSAFAATGRLPVGHEGAVPLPPIAPLAPGMHADGAVVGAPFGAIRAETLLEALERSGAVGIRLTPWRLMLLEDGGMPGLPDLCEAPDPRLSAHACPGAPRCASASVETRALAAALAPRHPGLHVSGCAKGCAHSGSAPITFVGRSGLYDLVRGGRASDAPERAGLTAEEALRA